MKAVAWIVGILMIGIPSIARAHPLAPSLVTLTSDGDTTLAEIRSPWTTTAPLVQPDPPCAVTVEGHRRDGEHRVEVQRWACHADLVLDASPDAAPLIVRSGARSEVLDAAHPRFVRDDDGPVFLRWVGLGVVHLALGLDHVLLVLGLLALIGFRRKLVAALTAFTLGHSLSLALAATGVLTLPSAPVEVAIASTLVLLGVELTRPETSTVRRHPWLLGVALGLVHGLGFAGALAELRLPEHAVAGALVAFNLGLELAQLALVLVAAALVAPALRALPRARPHALAAASWVVGVAGAAWTLDRLLP